MGQSLVGGVSNVIIRSQHKFMHVICVIIDSSDEDIKSEISLGFNMIESIMMDVCSSVESVWWEQCERSDSQSIIDDISVHDSIIIVEMQT